MDEPVDCIEHATGSCKQSTMAGVGAPSSAERAAYKSSLRQLERLASHVQSWTLHVPSSIYVVSTLLSRYVKMYHFVAGFDDSSQLSLRMHLAGGQFFVHHVLLTQCQNALLPCRLQDAADDQQFSISANCICTCFTTLNKTSDLPSTPAPCQTNAVGKSCCVFVSSPLITLSSTLRPHEWEAGGAWVQSLRENWQRGLWRVC